VTIKSEPMYVRRRRGLLALALLIVLGLVGGGAAWWWVKVGRWTETPVLAGQTQEAAVATLSEAGLGFITHEQYSEDIPLSVVISTQPTGGDPILKEGTVELWVSLGQERYPMPVVVGTTRAEAELALTTNHFALGQVTEEWSDTQGVGVVLAASQEPETPLAPNTAIDLTVSKGPEPINIPDVTGQSLEKAQATLEGLLFQVASTEENSREVPAGSIIRQEPAGGTGHHGDTITLVVSKGPVMITVPEVTDMKRDDALQELRHAGFNVVTEAASPWGFRNNRAVGTNPEAGALAAEGSTVTLFLS
jgi:serine/threonine-protein kinase